MRFVFGQPEEKAGATGPDGSGLNRRREDDWLEDTEPYHGVRPRTIEVDRPVDDVVGATLSGTEQDRNFRDTSVPKLPPEQQIRHEEEVQSYRQVAARTVIRILNIMSVWTLFLTMNRRRPKGHGRITKRAQMIWKSNRQKGLQWSLKQNPRQKYDYTSGR